MSYVVFRLAALVMLMASFLATPARADDLVDAKAFITKQLDLIKAGDVAGLKTGFTARLHDRITEAQVKAAQAQVKNYPIDQLVASVEPEKGGLKITMKNGRTLTHLVKIDGNWVADTIWFK